jgi:hypothetical protein
MAPKATLPVRPSQPTRCRAAPLPGNGHSFVVTGFDQFQDDGTIEIELPFAGQYLSAAH